MTASISQPSSSPAQLGFRMPAEWEPHQATWIAWPHNRTDWPGKFQTIPWVYAEIVRHLSRVERVEILVNDAAAEARARRILKLSNARLDAVGFHHIPTNRVWTRDYGPLFLVNDGKQLGGVKWRFNAWAKYSDWQLDEEAGARILAASNASPGWSPQAEVNGASVPLVLEGGSIDVNGQGVLVTTEECLLDSTQCRNPGIARAELEQALCQFLGIKKVVWLAKGIVGDDTHGHVDDITRFVGLDKLVTAVEPDVNDANHQPLRDNLERLRAARDQHGRPFQIVELPMPAPVIFRGQRLPASYANFYVANNLVLAPVFNDPNDRKALQVLAECFPDREVVGIYCRDLVWGLGTLHCMTQQQPRTSSVRKNCSPPEKRDI